MFRNRSAVPSVRDWREQDGVPILKRDIIGINLKKKLNVDTRILDGDA